MANLEVLLQLQRKFQTHSSGSQQFEEILPQTEDVVFAGVDSIDVVVVFCFQFLGNSYDGLHSFFVSKNVRFNSFVLLGGSFDSSQVKSEIVLSKRNRQFSKRFSFFCHFCDKVPGKQDAGSR